MGFRTIGTSNVQGDVHGDAESPPLHNMAPVIIPVAIRTHGSFQAMKVIRYSPSAVRSFFICHGNFIKNLRWLRFHKYFPSTHEVSYIILRVKKV